MQNLEGPYMTGQNLGVSYRIVHKHDESCLITQDHAGHCRVMFLCICLWPEFDQPPNTKLQVILQSRYILCKII